MKTIHEMGAKLGWKIRRWNYKFELFTMNIGYTEELGFRFCTFQYQFRDYSLLSFFISLPNRTTRQRIQIEELDVLWLRNGLWKWYDDITEDMLYANRDLTRYEKIKLKICEMLFI